ncbi:unnamed protein product [Adineta steineri]|uniref:Lipocalin/cytosolic fatty-acid binding domain-containing protein n=1 Tax=Adineta steineri TaxID=433720 RepID=A0A819UKY4_9BILA|nr:unnamed protein product [Adineta steineri]CAF4097285.1 unnamed protein product [Adineta steineri]
MHFLHLLNVFFITLANAWPDAPCRIPPPATGYTIEQYTGRWFEIGKIQTAGGAFFERDCVCTHLDVNKSAEDPSVVIVSNICNKKTVDGKLITANGTLTSTKKPADGRYNETIHPVTVPVAYNIIVLQTSEYSVEYDCVEQFGFTNYCVHILSRRSALNVTIVNDLLQLTDRYDLNPEKLDFVWTKHMNCTYI